MGVGSEAGVVVAFAFDALAAAALAAAVGAFLASRCVAATNPNRESEPHVVAYTAWVSGMTGNVSKLANWRGAGQVTPSHRSPTPSPHYTSFTLYTPFFFFTF